MGRRPYLRRAADVPCAGEVWRARRPVERAYGFQDTASHSPYMLIVSINGDENIRLSPAPSSPKLSQQRLLKLLILTPSKSYSTSAGVSPVLVLAEPCSGARSKPSRSFVLAADGRVSMYRRHRAIRAELPEKPMSTAAAPSKLTTWRTPAVLIACGCVIAVISFRSAFDARFLPDAAVERQRLGPRRLRSRIGDPESAVGLGTAVRRRDRRQATARRGCCASARSSTPLGI